MSAVKIVAILLLVAGIAALAFGSFAYSSTAREGTMAPFHFSMHERPAIPLPLWAGFAAIAAGALVLLGPERTRARGPR